MKRLYVGYEGIPTTTQPTCFCGFTDTGGDKGWLIFTGRRLKAVTFREAIHNPNCAYGGEGCNEFENMNEFIEKGITQCAHKQKDIFFFDSLRELYSWLLEE